MRPLIAVTGVPIVAGGVLGWRQGAVACTAAYLEALERAGADPVIVPPNRLDEAEAGARLGRFDGVLLTGGGDIDPALYGQETRPEVAHVSPARDEFEIPLV
ncbi:MAG TPA: gamma-glutamyl-gamma-aminobutyrate hydrolase family protein, partial [Acidimicrobiia bacterium]|nr:gamma-glutamyl-gamma-aminobutyrate hydrolase family protein [Acidimicrobiia bacterium]